jgi:hypothetical protein
MQHDFYSFLTQLPANKKLVYSIHQFESVWFFGGKSIFCQKLINGTSKKLDINILQDMSVRSDAPSPAASH